MLLLQMAVMIAVSWTGIYYEWTPNKTALGITAVAAAWLATKILVDRRYAIGTAAVLAALLAVRLFPS